MLAHYLEGRDTRDTTERCTVGSVPAAERLERTTAVSRGPGCHHP